MYHLLNLSKEYNSLALSILLSNLFNNDDIVHIHEDMIKLNLMKSRDIKYESLLIYSFSNDKYTFRIKDVLMLNIFPPVRFIEIEIDAGENRLHNRFMYKYFNNAYNVLNKIIIDAYNFNVYCYNPKCIGYKYKDNLIPNFAKVIHDEILSKDKDYTKSFEFKKFMSKLISYNNIVRRDTYYKILDFTPSSKVEVITVTAKILKVTVFSNDNSKRYTIYLDRGFSGNGQLRMMIDILRFYNYTP